MWMSPVGLLCSNAHYRDSLFYYTAKTNTFSKEPYRSESNQDSKNKSYTIITLRILTVFAIKASAKSFTSIFPERYIAQKS